MKTSKIKVVEENKSKEHVPTNLTTYIDPSQKVASLRYILNSEERCIYLEFRDKNNEVLG